MTCSDTCALCARVADATFRALEPDPYGRVHYAVVDAHGFVREAHSVTANDIGPFGPMHLPSGCAAFAITPDEFELARRGRAIQDPTTHQLIEMPFIHL